MREGLNTAVRQAFADYEKAKTEEEQQEVFVSGMVNVLTAIFEPIVKEQKRIADAVEEAVGYMKVN